MKDHCEIFMDFFSNLEVIFHIYIYIYIYTIFIHTSTKEFTLLNNAMSQAMTSHSNTYCSY